jgi:hypothetical protein
MTPEHLKRWTRPTCYAGAEWPEWYSFLGRSRDSDALERANFDAGLKAIGGESETVKIIRESHWAVGWVEWIGIHETDADDLKIADKIKGKLGDYPVVDEELFSQYETDEANETWRNCYRPKERLNYIRKHRSQFEFRDFKDLLSCVRGNYFAGYACDLLR